MLLLVVRVSTFEFLGLFATVDNRFCKQDHQNMANLHLCKDEWDDSRATSSVKVALMCSDQGKNNQNTTGNLGRKAQISANICPSSAISKSIRLQKS